MKVSLLKKITGLAVTVCALPVITLLIIILVQKVSVKHDVEQEMSRISHDNIAQISKDIYDMCESTDQLVRQQINKNLNVTEKIVNDFGGVKINSSRRVDWKAVNQFTKEADQIVLPALNVGTKVINKNSRVETRTPVVDDIVDLVGGTVTIFQRINEKGDMLRVATNVEKLDHTRAIGTYIPVRNPDNTRNEVVNTLLSGKTYNGRAYVVNDWYLTSYKPLFDRNNRVIGALYVGIKQEAISSLREAIMDITVGETGYVFVLGGKGKQKGDYIISKNGSRDGENILNAKDATGDLFIQRMVENGILLGRKEVDFIGYEWKNKDEKDSRRKISAITYFEPWDWVIGAGVYEDDFLKTKEIIAASLNQTSVFAIIAGLIIMTLGSLVAVRYSRSIIHPLREITDAANEVARGDLNQNISLNQNDEETSMLAGSVDKMIQSLRENDQHVKHDQNLTRLFMREIEQTANELKNGKLNSRAEASALEGKYTEMIELYNETLDAVINPLNLVVENVKRLGEGTIPERINGNHKGDFAAIMNKMNDCIESLELLIKDTKFLTHKAIEGDLAVRADSSRHHGDYQKIIAGINSILDEFSTPVQESQKVLEKMADGDLSKRVNGQYQGDHASIKNALNTSLDAVEQVIVEISSSANLMVQGSKLIADSSQSISHGAMEQAGSLEQISSTITDFEHRLEENSVNAENADQQIFAVQRSAKSGRQQMKDMLLSMDNIKDASSEINSIIKVIDEIAFQTNLLALNAAVEAARAGVHGKGFAVVAEEVRNLAQRSAKAAAETTDLISSTVNRISEGISLAHSSADSFTSIVDGVESTAELVNNISDASKEQTRVISEINRALDQIGAVTQTSTTHTEESASSAEELAQQARMLEEMVSHFKLTYSANGVQKLELTQENELFVESVGDNQLTAKMI